MKTYEEEMRKRLEDGRGPRRVNEEIAPGVKNIFAGNRMGVSAPKVTAPKINAPSVPAVGMPAVLKGKDLSKNYTASMFDNIESGNYPMAMYDEKMHNEKNGYLGLGYANSHIFNYDDPYRGDLDRQREAIENRDPFSYDYREDDLYKSIRALKEKEAEKAYNDGYAQLSRQFDGDIPVNMINKLLTTKGEIIDQADSYIPQLRQLAYGMYQDEGNKMLTDYGLTREAAADDYSKWLSDRDFIVSGAENKYARDMAREQFDYQKGIDERNFDYQKGQQEIALRYGVSDSIANIAVNLYNSGKADSLESALETAKIIGNMYK